MNWLEDDIEQEAADETDPTQLPPCEWCGSTFHGHYPNCPELED